MFIDFIKKYFAVIFFACAVGLITVLPQIILRYDLRDGYRGIIITGTDAEEYYNSRIREAYDGHWKLASPDLYEYKYKPYVQPPLFEIFVSSLAKIIGLSASQMIVAGKFFFPFLLYIVLYFFALAFSKNKFFSISLPVLLIAGSNSIFHPKDLLHIITYRWENISGMIDYTRPINPQLSSLIFFLWLLIFYKWLNGRRQIFYMLSVVLLGSMFYGYLYSWTLAFGIIGACFIFSLFNRTLKEDFPAAKLLLMMAYACIIGIPYWLNFYALVNDPLYSEVQKRYGFFSSHEFLWSSALAIDFFILYALYWRREKDKFFYILLGSFLSIEFLINQQVLTGFRFYPGHWHWYYTTPLSILLAFYSLYYCIEKRGMKKTAIIISVCAISFGLMNGILKQYNSYQAISASARERQGYAEIYQWLELNTGAEDVILADGDLNVNLAIYTSNNNYFSRWGEFYLIPHERFLDRLYARLYLNGASKENIGDFLTGENKDVYEVLYGRYRLRKGLCQNGCFNKDEIDAMKKDYLDFIQDINFENFLKKYRLDYAIWDMKNNPKWNLDQYEFMKFITEVNNVKIYKII